MIKFVILETEQGHWTVGHYNPKGDWNPLEDFGDKDTAKNECARLNGERENFWKWWS